MVYAFHMKGEVTQVKKEVLKLSKGASPSACFVFHPSVRVGVEVVATSPMPQRNKGTLRMTKDAMLIPDLYAFCSERYNKAIGEGDGSAAGWVSIFLKTCLRVFSAYPRRGLS